MSEAPRESLWRRWVVNPVLRQLSQGAEPRRLALAAAFGATLGVFPLLGTPTLLSLAVGIPMKLNQPVLQLFRELFYPVHLATLLLFIRAGEWLFGVKPIQLSISMLMEHFRASPAKFLADFGMLGLYAICVWVLIAPLLLGLVYGVSLPLFARLSKRFTPVPRVA